MIGEGPECQCVLDCTGHSVHIKYKSVIAVMQGLSQHTNTQTHIGT